MNSDEYFKTMVLVALAVDCAYVLIYATRTKWWRNWIGWALLTKAVGIAILLGFTAAFQVFGPDYAFRNQIRDVGITVVVVGFSLALVAMVRALFQRRVDS